MIEFRYVTEEHEAELESVKQLFREYTESLGLDLGFQDFEAECESLPGKYAAPDGVLILALVDGEAAGCIALRKSEERICEMKRLYVRDRYRGLKIGRALVQKVIEAAEQLPYDFMRLDTLATMTSAQALYRAFGFSETTPYIYNPLEGAMFMERKLR
ncbi:MULTISPECIES: GNAT family N-acetyltransferase [Brevibacillus]|jgi:putative acetyltransferase|uniref:Acetyltransferase CD1211 n=1 Tax=Brevibacillus parabrevis TaxID=54914 RepID=A0A4Y3PFF0_BREPA|nr:MULTISPECIES: GNAT family N-acetyltransferase [Brevibacillus]MBU8712321.1 GNAT family N-acetyltransferase [Brevibacillus parabrevis]MDH6349392.1 putative acetyltransferase [Brevibacillus sp. 1238]RNB96130.1 GNAT family N-acetyltransferase [Brevibacillus parabrevis]UED71616.1 GNAT family N-acetyltransferase [Brevibacillus sp. HD3.3A]GEB32263.1 acetyltransferase CD1211 [Brevibacillus parabrevis]